ncbi:MAG: hypothetical protein RR313_08980 [Anaerovoracaceae bacterium]
MTNSATTNHYDEISALLFNGTVQTGSGCLLWADDKSTLYCVTAKHCTCCMESGNEYDVKIKTKVNGEMKELSVISNKICSTFDDIAIYIIKIDEYTKNIPYTQTSNLLKKPNEIYINGYPLRNNSVRSAIPAKFISNNKEMICLSVESLDAYGIERFDEVNGISGSGCYEVGGGIVKFVGIENEAITCDVPFKELHAISIDKINEVISMKGFPALPAPTPSYITVPLGSYKTIERALTEYNFRNQWVDLEIFETIKENVEHHFVSSNVSLYLCGLSGIGKTRGVLQACELGKQSNTIYYNNYNEFSTDKANLRNHAITTGEKFYIVIDEVQFNHFTELNNEFEALKVYFKFILIGTMSKQQLNNGHGNILYLNLIEREDVIKVISAQYPSFSSEEQEIIYSLSHNDLRLAVLIARLYSNDKNTPSNLAIPLSVLPSSRLNDNYSSAESILNKTIEQHKSSQPCEVDITSLFNRLSLFVDIGYKGVAESEIEALAAFSNIKKAYFKSAIDYLTNINLGISKVDYFELSPRALAKLAFEQQGWYSIKYEIEEFMESIPNDLVRRRFFDRVDECEMTKEVNEALASWFQAKYASGVLANINRKNASEIMMFIEHSPQTGLTWLKDGIVNESDNTIKNFFGWDGRRNVVWTCEHLANFKEWFFDCEKILYKLAQNENENGISNNSQGVWSGLFSPILSNTEVPYKDRFELLMSRALQCTQENEKTMFYSAFSSSLNIESGVRLCPPQMVGGVITPPHWLPATLGEMIDILTLFLDRTSADYEKFSPVIKSCIFEVLCNNILAFLSLRLLSQLKAAMGKIFLNQDQKNQFITKLEWQIRIFKKQDNECKDIINDIELWIWELQDTTLVGRINSFLTRGAYSYGYSDSEKLKWSKEMEDLASEIFTSNKKIDTLMKIAQNENAKNECMTRLGESIANIDCETSLMEFIVQVLRDNLSESFVRGYFMGVYSTHKKLPQKLLNVLGEIKCTKPDFTLWATTMMNITLSGFCMILDLLNVAENIGYIENVKYKEWFCFLSNQQKLELLSSLSKCENKLKYVFYFKLCMGWMQQGDDFDGIFVDALETLERCLAESGKYEIYTVSQMLILFPPQYNDSVIEIMVSLFDFNESYSCVNPYVMEVIDHIQNEQNQKKIMDCLGEKLIDSEKSIKGPAFRGFFNRFSFDVIKEWIEIDCDNRAPLISYHLDAPSLENEVVSTLTAIILEGYPTDQTFKSFILGGYNLKAYAPKDYYDKKAEWLSLLSKYENSPNKLLQRWAVYEKVRIEQICKDHENDMAKMARYE